MAVILFLYDRRIAAFKWFSTINKMLLVIRNIVVDSKQINIHVPIDKKKRVTEMFNKQMTSS